MVARQCDRKRTSTAECAEQEGSSREESLSPQGFIDVIKFIGKNSLPYRGPSGNEAVHTLDDLISNHGVFLEVMLLLAKYDNITATHIRDAISKSRALVDRKIKAGKSGSKGRGKKFNEFIALSSISL